MSQAASDLDPFLERLTSHSPLGDAEREAVLALPNKLEQVQANRDFVRQGATVSHACIVVDGVAARCGHTADGARQITAFHFPGEAANLYSVVVPSSSSALQTLTTATIARIPHAALQAAASSFAALAEAFWRDCILDTAVLSEWVVNVGQREAKARLAHLLCEMAVRSKARRIGGETVFALPLTQIHLAEATGLTAVHVNRTLKALKDDGLVVIGHRTARILDWAALVRAGDFDPRYLHANGEPPSPLRAKAAA